ncbi:TetR/AcrR family transcriptional regulator [Streptomyces xanthophaeus]|uniref:TetR/AcrR family transcriptional regulator n=1 Tax=Streptomyces xanthophaeus TaxID=67385 RepID=UPI00370FF153
MIAEGGIAALTHRAVAAEAGVSKSSVTHHFATIDELMTAALTHSNHTYVAELRDALGEDSSTADLAALLATRHNRDHTRARAEYELHLMATRRPALRPAARARNEFLAGIARHHTRDPVAVLAFTAEIDGMLLDALLNDAPINPHTLRAVMDQTLQIPTKP